MGLKAKFSSVLTPLEANVLLFLAVSLIAGSVVKYLDIKPFRQHIEEQVVLDSLAAAEAEEDSLLSDLMEPPVAAQKPGRNPSAVKQLPAPQSININTAGKEELMRLPQVGEKTADEIIRHRIRYGKFTSVEGLMDVKGIGEKKFEKLKPYIRV